jgi:hypothetical protein
MSETNNTDEVKANVKNADTWTRGLFILIYAVIGNLLIGIIWLIVVFQFFAKLFTGDLNANLKEFSATLTRYAMLILEYVTFQSDDRPWPFEGTPEEGGGTDA